MFPVAGIAKPGLENKVSYYEHLDSIHLRTFVLGDAIRFSSSGMLCQPIMMG
jgi:hypothetical protein